MGFIIFYIKRYVTKHVKYNDASIKKKIHKLIIIRLSSTFTETMLWCFFIDFFCHYFVVVVVIDFMRILSGIGKE